MRYNSRHLIYRPLYLQFASLAFWKIVQLTHLTGVVNPLASQERRFVIFMLKALAIFWSVLFVNLHAC